MFLKEFFYMPKSDRRAILFILALTVAAAVVVTVSSDFDTSNPLETLPNHRQPGATDSRHGGTAGIATGTNGTGTNIETFDFDPNTADSTTLRRLGLHPWQIRNIYKYRSKGGVYRQKEDFAYVYGLTTKDYRRLAPHIIISADYRPASTLPEVRRARNSAHSDLQNEAAVAQGHGNGPTTHIMPYTPKLQRGEHVDINKADTNDLKKIPGIGSYYARQTVQYRKRLGGFVTREQLLEIEGFPKEATTYINIDKENVEKINVNRQTLAQIRRHPYINYYQARAIIDYRRLHGNIRDISELRLLKEFTDKDIARMAPYMEY